MPELQLGGGSRAGLIFRPSIAIMPRRHWVVRVRGKIRCLRSQFAGHEERATTIMNKWLLATILAAAAIFMYLAIIVKMSP
jgi:hypothetical protein